MVFDNLLYFQKIKSYVLQGVSTFYLNEKSMRLIRRLLSIIPIEFEVLELPNNLLSNISDLVERVFEKLS